MTTTNLQVGFEEKTLLLELSRVRDKRCYKPPFLLPGSAAEHIKFLFVPLRGGFETFSQHLKVPSGHSHTGRTEQSAGHWSRML